MTTKKILATAALSALAVPASALADKPANPGSQGKAKSEQAKAKTKGVGFTVGGVDLSGLTVTDGKLTGALKLDPTSANAHARRFLELSKADVAGEKTVSLGTAGDAVILKYNGVSAGDTLLPTDRVKVIGKLSGGKTLDIRKITVTRGDKKPAETTSTGVKTERRSPAEQCKGKAKKKAEGEKKSAYAKCVSEAARKQNEQDDDDKTQS